VGRLKIQNCTRDTALATEADVADSSRKRRVGLLKHANLPAGQGLWIAPCEGIHTFGMKFPIDVIFLDSRKRVLKTRSDMGPRRIALCLMGHSVLELPAGTVAATHTQKGDQLVFEEQAG
jgi:uncharacterized membrane protein (UPF0127 family)